MGSVPEPASSPAEAESSAEAEGAAEAAGQEDADSSAETAAEGAGEAEGGKHASRGGAHDARLPWSGRERRKADILCWAGISLSGIYYLSLLPFRAALVGTHPVLLEFLNGSTEAIVAAAAFARIGHGSLLVVMLVSIPGLMKFDPLYWWAGRLWGERVIELMFSRRRNRTSRYMAWANRWGRWVIWPAVVLAPFLPVPTALIYVVAGSSGMSLITFILLDMIGSLMWAGMLAGLGYELGHRAVVVAQEISRYGLWFSLAIIALIIFSQVRRARSYRSPDPVSRPDPGEQS